MTKLNPLQKMMMHAAIQSPSFGEVDWDCAVTDYVETHPEDFAKLYAATYSAAMVLLTLAPRFNCQLLGALPGAGFERVYTDDSL